MNRGLCTRGGAPYKGLCVTPEGCSASSVLAQLAGFLKAVGEPLPARRLRRMFKRHTAAAAITTVAPTPIAPPMTPATATVELEAPLLPPPPLLLPGGADGVGVHVGVDEGSGDAEGEGGGSPLKDVETVTPGYVPAVRLTKVTSTALDVDVTGAGRLADLSPDACVRIGAEGDGPSYTVQYCVGWP